ncbi:MAG: hypothetical protein A2283_10880 [Lentisphaerae bacterium RIFOXYA12_FULL_48_11]|nr:MAG: hypothetical protein A2283_10880 [Lentisphaerae bacterium RIFOXYA12_FULL_48_11]
MKTFSEFGLVPALMQAVTDLGFETPTPIQSKVIPLLLKHERDLVGLAQTGTGKTAAYGLPLLQLTDIHSHATQVLILCPTRELCLQIAGDLSDFAKHMRGVKILAVYGGASIGDQIKALSRGVHIIVATPGRMNDVLRRKKARLEGVQRVVLDEADEMLKMGFEEDLKAILDEVPDSARTFLFSATMPKQVAAIAGKYMHNPEEIIVGQRNSGSEKVKHECYMVHAKDRYPALKRILDYYRDIYGIVFCRTRIETQEVAGMLMADGYNADALHGDMSQDQRDRVMKNFRNRSLQILVATDVAARGLDVNDLTHVINYNLPDEADGYTHRSGRTGRAGKEGISVAIVNMREEYKIHMIERIIRKKFEHKSVPSASQVCESRLVGLVEQIKQVKVDDKHVDRYMPVINAALVEMSKEEIIKRFVMLEGKRFLDYYKNAPDLNAGGSHSHGAQNRQDKRGSYRQGNDERSSDNEMVRLRVNIGSRNGLTPSDLISAINRATPGPMVRIGRIAIEEHESVFEISEADAEFLMPTLNEATYHGRDVRAVVERGGKHGHDRHDRHRGGGYGGRKNHHRRH